MAGYGSTAVTQRPKPNPLAAQYNLFNNGVNQNVDDYHKIMGGYNNLLDSNNNLSQQPNAPRTYTPGQITAQTVTPQTYNYKQSQDSKDSIAGLKDLSTTGGYSAQGIADLRERGISPIRSVYANANRDIDRQRALQGGYSPNAVAAKSRMARELSDKIAGQVTNVNAGIAQNVASNRLQAAPAYASAAGNENTEANTFGQRNVDTVNDANRFNTTNVNDTNKFNEANKDEASRFNITNQNDPYALDKLKQGGALSALSGMSSLYGTTPALANTFGNQAMSAAQLQQQEAQRKQGGYFQTMGQLTQALR